MRYLLLTWTVLSLSFCLGCGSSTDSDFGDDVAVSVDLSYQHTADMADVREGDGSFFDSTPEVSPEVSEETVPDAIEDAEISEAPDRQEQAPDEEEAPDEEVACVPDCSGRTCGPDPVCGELCGSCDDPDFPACNDGVCEFTCDESACSAQTFDGVRARLCGRRLHARGTLLVLGSGDLLRLFVQRRSNVRHADRSWGILQSGHRERSRLR